MQRCYTRRHKLRSGQYEDEKSRGVVTKEVTLDEWYQIWMDTCKKNCREATKTTYAGHYRRVQKALGWRKLTTLNLIIIQQAINELDTDNERKISKKILGHGSLQLTMDLYCHVTEDTLLEAMELMERV